MMLADTEAQIHQYELDAYSSVLRAFKAQADSISWEKEGLITELRKELRVSDDEHRELLAMVNADEFVHMMREWRQSGRTQVPMLTTSQSFHNALPSPSVSASLKKQKTSQQLIPYQPYGMSTPSFQPQSASVSLQPMPSAGRGRAPFGSRGRKPRLYPSTGLTGRVQFTQGHGSGVLVTHESAEAEVSDPLIGRRVLTRCPEDNNFYEAVITNYNHIEGRHALVYNKNTTKETWQWFNLEEISAEDIRWVSEDPRHSLSGGRELTRSMSQNNVGGGGRGRVSVDGQPGKELLIPEQSALPKDVHINEIEILHTDTLIEEVQKVLDAGQPSLHEIGNVKRRLQEHEQALADAISRLADASDCESGRQQRQVAGWESSGKDTTEAGNHMAVDEETHISV